MIGRGGKRFWTSAAVVETAGGHAIELDGRPVRTPARALLVLPSRAMADAVADEWQAQTGRVDPLSMPFTRSANAAIDKVGPQHGEVAAMLAAYGDADLLCYRADAPRALSARQDAEWNPVLDWAETALDARLAVHRGVMHRGQDKAVLERLSAQVHALSAFQMAGFHDLVSLSGSLILGFAAARGWRDAETVWQLSRLDESWQESEWGTDEEAAAAAEVRRQAFLHAKRFFDLS
ncbi:MAG: ATPase [Rhodobacteraceae bacterium]|nr:ATPase [Paracoccaceae bacterium]